jgi:hypothetical protein
VVQIICRDVERVDPAVVEEVVPVEAVVAGPDQGAVDDAELGDAEMKG